MVAGQLGQCAVGVPIDTAVAEVCGVDRPRRGNDQRRRRTATGVAVFGHEPLRLPLGIGKNRGQGLGVVGQFHVQVGRSRAVQRFGRRVGDLGSAVPAADAIQHCERSRAGGCVGQGVVRPGGQRAVSQQHILLPGAGALAGRRTVDKALAAVFQSRPHRVDVRPPRGVGVGQLLHQLHHGAGDAQIVQVCARLAGVDKGDEPPQRVDVRLCQLPGPGAAARKLRRDVHTVGHVL